MASEMKRTLRAASVALGILISGLAACSSDAGEDGPQSGGGAGAGGAGPGAGGSGEGNAGTGGTGASRPIAQGLQYDGAIRFVRAAPVALYAEPPAAPAAAMQEQVEISAPILP